MGQYMSVNVQANKELPASSGAGSFLMGGGQMGAMMRDYDWEQTILGAPQSWDASLKTCIRIMLTSPQPMFIWWGKESLINLYNDAYAAFLNAKHPQALGMSGRTVWSEVWEELQPKVDKVYQNEGTYDDGAMFIMHRKGYAEETYVNFSYSPIAGDDGVVKGLFCVCEDETDRVITTRQLATLKEVGALSFDKRITDTLYQNIIESLGANNKDFPFAGIYEIKQDDASVRLKASIGMHKNSNVLPADFSLQAADSTIHTAIHENKIVLAPVNPDITDLPTGFWKVPPSQLAYIPIGIPGKEYPYALIITALSPYRLYDDVYKQFCISIAERLSLELSKMLVLEEETKRAEALAEIDRSKTVFFSNISHEFRTPLTLILGSLESLLENNADLSTRHQEMMDASHRNALRMLKLVNTLLDFSRIESGKMQANFTKVDVGTLTQKLASNFNTLMDRAGLAYNIHIEAISQPVYVDIQMWEKILFNLLSNAFKYTWKGSVTVKLFTTNEQLVLEVSDTGIGIPAADLTKIFERFHQVQGSAGRSYEGSGIGLSLTRELVWFHKGQITVESKEGAGSVFRVTIPVGNAHLSQTQISTSLSFPDVMSDIYLEEATDMLRNMRVTDRINPAAGQAPSDIGKDTILVVDDNADMRQYLKALLEKDYNVICAVNGLEALIKIRREQPALVLTDVMMPIMDGAQLVSEIRSSPSTASLPVIILSARAGEECRMEGYDFGADDYLIKPFSAKELRARVAGQIKTHKIRTDAQSQLHNIFKVAPAAIAVVQGSDFKFVLGNAAYQKMVNRSESDLVGKTVREVFPEIDGQGVMEILNQVYQSERPLAMKEFPLRLNIAPDHAKELHYFDFAVEPLRNSVGVMYALLVLAVDVTEQVIANKRLIESEQKLSKLAEELETMVIERTEELRLANETLELKNQELNKQNQELASFNYIASHDLQEPLRKIQTFASRIIEMDETHLSERARDFLHRMNGAAARMQQLIVDLLSFTRLRGNTDGQFEVTSLDVIIEAVKSDLSEVIAEKNATIIVQHNCTPSIIPLKFRQLMQNLFSNALKFSRPGIPPVIEVKCETIDNREKLLPAYATDTQLCHISVQDNGVGFEQKFSNKIFEVFQRLHDKATYQGTGIGLAIVKKIVENHDGIVIATGELEKGARFDIYIPMRE
ncbi:His Kinase A (phospho-acceptor) domain-containing protein [Chitinophaga jiangningensis]|uniref:histidine kinase n=1 Tax=Chitinophaga jiangningensis TaxID=1419482 RepID=A0A1M6YSJ5_9BACT|nr:ATP-binding protein [Chitinophaga jiangningensis]SHL21284.1 His Kinase A (phospho-acceptor) domain-containing protein [Chitinophaga jiangningensis]